jgi:CubicO group peptidase (beta-lactamase class C family)
MQGYKDHRRKFLAMAISAPANIIDITISARLNSFSGQPIPGGIVDIMKGIPAIYGKCDSRFLRVREAFAENFESGKELGAAVAVTIDGRVVVRPLGGPMPIPGVPMGPNERSFDHPGAGGSIGFADPEARVGFGYVMNLTAPDILINERPALIINALFESL